MTQLRIGAAKFKLGQLVRKKSGSWWEGEIVGLYRTEQTPIGYCVQAISEEMGPVQLYPESALEAFKKTDPTPKQMELIKAFISSGKLTLRSIAIRVGVNVYQVERIADPELVERRKQRRVEQLRARANASK